MALVGNWWLARVLRRHTAYPVGERVGQWLVDRQLKATIDFDFKILANVREYTR
jgi:hypothetical protein